MLLNWVNLLYKIPTSLTPLRIRCADELYVYKKWNIPKTMSEMQIYVIQYKWYKKQIKSHLQEVMDNEKCDKKLIQSVQCYCCCVSNGGMRNVKRAHSMSADDVVFYRVRCGPYSPAFSDPAQKVDHGCPWMNPGCWLTLPSCRLRRVVHYLELNKICRTVLVISNPMNHASVISAFLMLCVGLINRIDSDSLLT